MRKVLRGLLVLAILSMSCAPEYNYTVVHEVSEFDREQLDGAMIAVVLPDAGPTITAAAVSVVDNPSVRVQELGATLGACLVGDFELKSSFQGDLRRRVRENVCVPEQEAIARLHAAVAFEPDEYGVLSCTVEDRVLLSDLAQQYGWQYLLFLEDLQLDEYYTDVHKAMIGVHTDSQLKLVAQVFLLDARDGNLLYHGFVTGKGYDAAYDYRLELSFVGHLFRGALGLR